MKEWRQSQLPDWIRRGMVDLFPEDGLAERLDQTDQPLRVKLGIDPTGSDIHLGHSILFRRLRAFQDAGHTAVLILGDFTARIGDPTGKSATRVQLSAAEVEAYAETYLVQLGLGQPRERALLDFETPGRLEVRRNSEWLAGLDLPQVIELLGTSTVGQMLAKEDFANRYGNGTPISLHEFLYPLLQGYDSVAIEADVELGGTDQKFNVAMGRDLQRHFGQRPQFGMLLPILPGTDGVQKMSKSLGNTVGLREDPLSMYSKLEKVPDALVDDYITLLTDFNLKELPENPRERQKIMALDITSNFHGEDVAKMAQKNAVQLVCNNGNQSVDLVSVLSAIGICATSSDAQRQIKGGAVRLNGEKLTDPNYVFTSITELEGKVVQLGKKVFRRLIK
jgi:tyrosyl-tRNA synthetase